MREKEKGDFMGEITRTEGQEMTREGKKLRRKTTEHNLVESFRKKKTEWKWGLKTKAIWFTICRHILVLVILEPTVISPEL